MSCGHLLPKYNCGKKKSIVQMCADILTRYKRNISVYKFIRIYRLKFSSPVQNTIIIDTMNISLPLPSVLSMIAKREF